MDGRSKPGVVNMSTHPKESNINSKTNKKFIFQKRSNKPEQNFINSLTHRSQTTFQEDGPNSAVSHEIFCIHIHSHRKILAEQAR